MEKKKKKGLTCRSWSPVEILVPGNPPEKFPWHKPLRESFPQFDTILQVSLGVVRLFFEPPVLEYQMLSISAFQFAAFVFRRKVRLKYFHLSVFSCVGNDETNHNASGEHSRVNAF